MVATIIITLWSMYIRNSNVRVVMGLSHIAEPGSDMASLHHLNQFRRVAVLDCVLRLCAFSALLFWFVVSLHVYIVSLSFSSASAEKLFLSALCPGLHAFSVSCVCSFFAYQRGPTVERSLRRTSLY